MVRFKLYCVILAGQRCSKINVNPPLRWYKFLNYLPRACTHTRHVRKVAREWGKPLKTKINNLAEHSRLAARIFYSAMRISPPTAPSLLFAHTIYRSGITLCLKAFCSAFHTASSSSDKAAVTAPPDRIYRGSFPMLTFIKFRVRNSFPIVCVARIIGDSFWVCIPRVLCRA